MSRFSKAGAGALAAGLSVLVFAAPAMAKSEKVVGGHATVRASMKISAFLLSRGITVTPLGPAQVGGGAMTMPMVNGTISLPTGSGTMSAKGGLQYKNGSKVVRIHSYKITHKKNGAATITAIVNGHRIVIATMSAPMHTSGNTAKMSGGLHISAVWAKTINHLVGMRVVHAGETIGQLSMSIKMA